MIILSFYFVSLFDLLPHPLRFAHTTTSTDLWTIA